MGQAAIGVPVEKNILAGLLSIFCFLFLITMTIHILPLTLFSSFFVKFLF